MGGSLTLLTFEKANKVHEEVVYRVSLVGLSQWRQVDPGAFETQAKPCVQRIDGRHEKNPYDVLL